MAATLRPITALMPSSSSSSRCNASFRSSSRSTLPPGNSHLSGNAWASVRWQISILLSLTINAATTCFISFYRSAPKPLKHRGTEDTEETEENSATKSITDSHFLLSSFPLCFKGVFLHLSQALGRRKQLRMNRRRQRMQTLNQRTGGRIKKLIIDAVHASVLCRLRLFPSALWDDLLQRHSVARAAPRSHDHIRIGRGNFFFSHLFSGASQKPSTSRLHQFGYPCLRKNQRLAPLFAINQRPRNAHRLLPHGTHFLFHPCHHRRTSLRLAASFQAHDPRDHHDVFVNVIKAFGREPQERNSCLEDF